MTYDDHRLDELLGDPALWAEPDPGLEAAVVAAVADAAAGRAPASRAPASRAPASRAGRRRRWLALGGVAVAAAAAVLVAVVVTSPEAGSPQVAASLEPTELAPQAYGEAELTRTDAGWRIELDAAGLPRLDDGRFYQAWLRHDAGELVSLGTFNEGGDVVLWAGVSPLEFPTLTVTEEAADGDPASSGRVVLHGPVSAGGS